MKFFVFALCVCVCCCLDATWTPNSDGPLPQSEKYRSALRNLCKKYHESIKNNVALSPELEEKKPMLISACKQLSSDDNHVNNYDNNTSKSTVFTWLAVIGAIYYWYNHYGGEKLVQKLLGNRTTNRSPQQASKNSSLSPNTPVNNKSTTTLPRLSVMSEISKSMSSMTKNLSTSSQSASTNRDVDAMRAARLKYYESFDTKKPVLENTM